MKNALITLVLVGLLLPACSEQDPITAFAIHTHASPVEGGRIDPEDGDFESGDLVQVTAHPFEYFRFSHWEGDWSGEANPYMWRVTSEIDIIAVFVHLDSDSDGVPDIEDSCPDSPINEAIDQNGCSPSQRDTDGDGVTDDLDQCVDTPADEQADEYGCSPSQKDTDGDGIDDSSDSCPNTPEDAEVDENGCADSQKDSDGDGVNDDADQCPNTRQGVAVDNLGCSPVLILRTLEPTQVGPQYYTMNADLVDPGPFRVRELGFAIVYTKPGDPSTDNYDDFMGLGYRPPGNYSVEVEFPVPGIEVRFRAFAVDDSGLHLAPEVYEAHYISLAPVIQLEEPLDGESFVIGDAVAIKGVIDFPEPGSYLEQGGVYVDESVIAEIDGSLINIQWDTTGWELGSHEIRIVAFNNFMDPGILNLEVMLVAPQD